MSKRGRRPALIINNEVLDKIEEFSGLGMTQKQIAAYFGITYVTLNNLKKKNYKLDQAFKKGKSAAIAIVCGQLRQQINLGNITAIIFYLKTQAGWSEKNTLELQSDVKSKNVIYRIDTTDSIEASKIYQSIMTGSYKDEHDRSSK